MSEGNGVIITLREIYDSQQEAVAGVKRLEEQVKQLQDGLKEVKEIDEKSTQALNKADQALAAVKSIQSTLNKIGIGTILSLIGGAIGMLFYFVKN